MLLTYSVAFVLNFIACYFLMKLISWYSSPLTRRHRWQDFFFSPYVSVRSLEHNASRRVTRVLSNLLVYGALTALMVTAANEYLGPLNYWKTLLLVPMIYFLTETMGAFGQSLFLWKRTGTVSIHYRPLLAPSLSQFWGRRWNLWIQEWLRDVNHFAPTGRKGRILLTFAISGLFHEAMVNLPYWLVFGESYFGTMMLYFVIQSLALWGDKLLLKGSSPAVKRTYLWTSVVLPSPLFINVPLLTFLGIKNV